MSEEKALSPAVIFGRRVKEARKGRGLSQRTLAELLTESGYKIDRTTVVRIERGARADVSLSDLFAFAQALDVFPVHLLAPLEDESPVAVTPSRVVSARKARAWIRGQELLRGADPRGVFNQLPEREQRALVEMALTKDMDALARGLMAEETARRTHEVMDELHEPKEEDDG